MAPFVRDNSPPADTRPALRPRGWETRHNSAPIPWHHRDTLASDTRGSGDCQCSRQQGTALLRPRALWAVQALALLCAPAREYGCASAHRPRWADSAAAASCACGVQASAPIAVEEVLLAILWRLHEQPQACQEHDPPCEPQACANGLTRPPQRAPPREEHQSRQGATPAEP